jgi:hypothetical protein
VFNSFSRKNEGRSSGQPELVERGLLGGLSTKQKLGVGAVVAVKLAIVSAVMVGLVHRYTGKSNSTDGDTTNTTQVTSTTNIDCYTTD